MWTLCRFFLVISVKYNKCQCRQVVNNVQILVNGVKECPLVGKRSEGSFFLHKGPWRVIFSRVRNFSFLRYSYCSLHTTVKQASLLGSGITEWLFLGCFSLVCCRFERLVRLRSNVRAAAHSTLQVLKKFYPVLSELSYMEISLQNVLVHIYQKLLMKIKSRFNFLFWVKICFVA